MPSVSGNGSDSSPLDIPNLSDLQEVINADIGANFDYSPADKALAIQVRHDLQYAQDWRSLQVHTRAVVPPFGLLPRPILSGLPPRRLYIHPDEQIELLKAAKKQKRNECLGTTTECYGSSTSATPTLWDIKAEAQREWVLPTRLDEKWTLKRLAEVFDNLTAVPPEDSETVQSKHSMMSHDKWRQTKRVVLATVDPDSTIVYYILHDGIVKPRQN
jgi:tRNA-splicing endonuclease subunit Sen15, fungi type